jgi:hypothetical protein
LNPLPQVMFELDSKIVVNILSKRFSSKFFFQPLVKEISNI